MTVPRWLRSTAELLPVVVLVSGVVAAAVGLLADCALLVVACFASGFGQDWWNYPPAWWESTGWIGLGSFFGGALVAVVAYVIGEIVEELS